MEVLVDGLPVDCLLNIGSEVTLVPGSLVQELPKRRIVSQIRAANGTLIDVLGEVELPVVLKGREVIIRRVASNHVAEMLLGIDWLETNGAVWDLRRRELYMHGLVNFLKPMTKTVGPPGCGRRTVQLPARSETDVAGRVVYKDLKNPWVTWASVRGAPVEEVRVARTILPPSCKGIPVRVMNLARYPVTLRQGMVLGKLEPVEIVKKRPSEATGPEVDAGSLPLIMSTCRHY